MAAETKPSSGGAGPRPRPRRSGRAGPGPFGRPILVAVAVAALGAAFLFWPRGRTEPAGIGERVSVVTAEQTGGTSSLPAQPHSGDVDLDRELAPLIPEGQNPAGIEEPSPHPSNQQPAGPSPEPQANGAWAIQLGAFGSQANAETLMARLRRAGYSPQLRTANTASGQLLFKVWIGFFTSRQNAAAFARQHQPELGEGLPVHR